MNNLRDIYINEKISIQDYKDFKKPDFVLLTEKEKKENIKESKKALVQAVKDYKRFGFSRPNKGFMNYYINNIKACYKKYNNEDGCFEYFSLAQVKKEFNLRTYKNNICIAYYKD